MPEHHGHRRTVQSSGRSQPAQAADLLHAHDGRTLNELCEHLDMTRQGVTQHPRPAGGGEPGRHRAAVAARNCTSSIQFRFQEIYERWIAKFEKPRLKALSDLKRRLEKING